MMTAVTGVSKPDGDDGDFLQALGEVMKPAEKQAEEAAVEDFDEVVESHPLLDVEQCSNAELLEALGPYPCRFVDWGSWFVNDIDTAVFAVGEMDFPTAMKFAAMLAEVKPDECEVRFVGGVVLFRLWWD